ncbi:VOC family protein [Nocardioides sp. KR10-350]|uniref:VOC family protein n=1 Tax=Nocardioides cheoyonin TaxID=3156615 RepID=UPI0032B4321A
MTIDLDFITKDRERIKKEYLLPEDSRPEGSARGIHHTALLSSDVRRTIDFYQGLLEFPLTEIFENRDYAGSDHFFFDVGANNLLAFFTLPGLDLGEYAEVLGGLHHLAISVTNEKWDYLRAKLDDAGIDYLVESKTSIYLKGPDGERIELLADPLGSMYGTKVL